MQPLTEVLTKALETESTHRGDMMTHMKNESALRGNMISFLQSDLQFRKEQARITNKSDQLLTLIAAGIPFAQAQKYVSEEFKNLEQQQRQN